MAFSGAWFSGHKPHSHFDGPLIELSHYPFAGTLRGIVLTWVSALLSLVSMVWISRASLCAVAVTALGLSMPEYMRLKCAPKAGLGNTGDRVHGVKTRCKTRYLRQNTRCRAGYGAYIGLLETRRSGLCRRINLIPGISGDLHHLRASQLTNRMSTMSTDRTEEERGMQLGYDKAEHGINRQELGAIGERAVRDRLNTGSYGHEGLPVFAYVLAWLADAEFARLAEDSARRDAREEETLSIARSASSTARRANIIAISAAILAMLATISAAIIGVMYGSK